MLPWLVLPLSDAVAERFMDAALLKVDFIVRLPILEETSVFIEAQVLVIFRVRQTTWTASRWISSQWWGCLDTIVQM